MKKNIQHIITMALFMLPLAIVAIPAAAATPWNTTGNYVVAMNFMGTDYAHDMSLAQDGLGNLTGSGGYPAGGPLVYTWVLTSGSVTGDVVDFYANYTATPDAVTPQTILHATGTIAESGTMSGVWSDNYQGGVRTGTWMTTSGAATATVVVLPGSLAAEDFGVVSYDTSLGMLKGYTAGFGLTDATFAGAQSVVVKLYAGATLLQTNTATPKVGIDIVGAQISSPFDVSGTFDYVTDGYWANVREVEFGQSTPATRVVATVTLANGKVVTAENTTLVGDGSTVFPPAVSTTTARVIIDKFIDGAWATSANAATSSFGMTATWSSTTTGTGSGGFAIGPTGFNSANAYEAVTADMSLGASYSVSELIDGTTGLNCASGTPFAFVGYSTGDTRTTAALAQATTTMPNFTNITSDVYVIVHNHACPLPTAPIATTSLTIVKNTTGGNGTFNFTSDNGILPFSITTASGTGSTTILNLAPGVYHISEATSSDWAQTGNTCAIVTLASGTPATCIVSNLKNVLPSAPGDISGTKYEDKNGNGTQDHRERKALAGWTIYLDTNDNGILDTGEMSTKTDKMGNYRFSILPVGVYHVREVLRDGWMQTYPLTGKYDITLLSGVSEQKKDFGNFKKGMISAYIFNDKNGNGLVGKNEPGLKNWEAKLQLPNGAWITKAVDEDGYVAFYDLGPGSYIIREVNQTGWKQTSTNPPAITITSGKIVEDNDFGNTKKTPVWRGNGNGWGYDRD